MRGGVATFFGLRIIVSEYALQETTERLFPVSRHRSKRIHKKLVRRFGGEFRKAPAIWKTPSGIVMHPDQYAALRARLAEMEAGHE
jgi:hypothetical protein